MKIEMKGINKAFGSNQVLKDAGFVLEDGEVQLEEQYITSNYFTLT